MEPTINIELNEFCEACDSFIKGKYILADIKISNILRAIAYSEKIKNIISKCLINFDFDKEFKLVVEASVGGDIVLPTDVKKVVGICFSVLYKIDNKELNFYDFLNQYFKKNNELSNQEFISFSNIIVVPFKDAIANMFTNTHILTEAEDYKNNIYNKLTYCVNINKKTIAQYRLRNINEEELTILMDSMLIACDKNDKQQVFSLMVAMDYFSQVHKKCRPLFIELQNCFK